jgi:hypothetical protein
MMEVLIDPAELRAGIVTMAVTMALAANATIGMMRNEKRRIFGCLTFLPSEPF